MCPATWRQCTALRSCKARHARSAPDERHRGAANFTFIDGHVQGDAAQAMGYVQSADGTFACSPAAADNSHFSGTGKDINPPSVQEADEPDTDDQTRHAIPAKIPP